MTAAAALDVLRRFDALRLASTVFDIVARESRSAAAPPARLVTLGAVVAPFSSARGDTRPGDAQSGTTAVAWISTRASSSIRPETSTTAMAGKLRPMVAFHAAPISFSAAE